ncbi:MAG TPA: hypothetical protein VK689_19430 [Armatimonadota bacterium]|nr:hypothetical protein [Armatimonadota bacterium]
MAALWAASPAPSSSAPVNGPGATRGGIVSHVKVLSNRVEDVSSMEAWKRSFIKEGMTDEQKAMAVWETVVKFRHQDNPPNEYLQESAHPHDPIKTFNVYGYGQCCCASSNIEALGRYAGLPARGRIIQAHSVPELFWGGRWRMLDASLLTWFPGPDGQAAGVDDIIAGVKAWYEKNPGLKGNDAKLREFMRAGGWKKGPEILAGCRFFDPNGWLPAATHGWYATMQEYDGSHSGIYEYGYSEGYGVNVQLRPGERLTRNWSNVGLHVNQPEGGEPGSLKGGPGQGDLRYSPGYGDVAPGRIGNGTLEYDVPLASGAFRSGALEAENLAGAGGDRRGPAVRVADVARAASLVLRMPSSYVYLNGSLACNAIVGRGGGIAISLSDNNGLDWKPVAELTASGERRIDLKPLVYRRYDYRLKLVLKGRGTGLNALRLTHAVQHSQRALPALAQGQNEITFSTGPDEGTITLEGSTNPDVKGKQLVLSDFHPWVEGVEGPPLHLTGGTGSLTFPVTTPGEMKRLRFGAHYRARDERDGWDLQVSFDGGKSFKTVDRCAGPAVGNSKYVTYSDIPPGTRSALVRFAGTQRNTTCLFDFRIDADYREPHGTFRPVRVTYVWDEAGVEKRDVHVAARPTDTYRIQCAGKPTMKSLIVELAQ